MSALGAYDIDFDKQGMPVIPKAVEAMHRRAMAATASRDAERINAAFLDQEKKVIHEFYVRVRSAVEYFIGEMSRFHAGEPVQVQQVRLAIQQFRAEAARLGLRLKEMQQLDDNEMIVFEEWRREDDRMRHARLSKYLRKQEDGIYKIDKMQLKVGKHAKGLCLEAASTMQRISAILERVNRAFEQQHFSHEDMVLFVRAFNELLDRMRQELTLIDRLEAFERKNIALFDEQIKLDFLVERTLRENNGFLL